MANTKKKAAAPAAKTEVKAAVPAEVKAAPVAKAEAKVEAKAAPAAKAETKPAAKKAAEKKAAPKAAEKKPAAKKAAPKATEKKPAAKKAAPKAAAKKPAAKKAPAKKQITVDDVAAKLYKKLDAKKAAAINDKVAVDIKLYGTFEAHMYIEVKDGVLSVAPYDYMDHDLAAAISVENMLAVIDGKLKLADALADGRLYAAGKIDAAVKIASLF